MIRYALKCGNEHEFESWFASAEAFEKLKSASMVACPVCGANKVEKSLMAPRVSTSRKKAQLPVPVPETPVPAPAAAGPLQSPASEIESKIAEMRREVEANSDYVGLSFAAEARKMHDGDIPHRSIYGEARSDEAKKLIEDGVPVAPLPFMPTRKTN